ncbi:(Na+)-NQR maturation NqrM [Nitrincola tapanii]|uniref:(Na+)-NQR maturation NqrM n=1 Tax=Nitrincola tapanii TaxID=1708751 RepID=A0A5A9W788_9GAMM|nr:(Na+)-NQR maturation NqrM [Nitrincola tapanii]KAA0875331.1 (Na+)-NQR maturation NqrM [Nitrincola tapanii]
MDTFIITLAVLLALTLAMSVGVLMGRKPISGSCGGMSALGMEKACDVCGGDKQICDDVQEKNRDAKTASATTDLAYEVKSKG